MAKDSVSAENLTIPDTTTYIRKPEYILHYKYDMIEKDGKFKFKTTRMYSSGYGNDIDNYIKDTKIKISPAFLPNPLDISITEDPGKPLFLVIELGTSLDWYFKEGSMGMTPKSDNGDEDFGLHWVDQNNDSQTGTIKYDKCRKVWLGIAKRDPGEANSYNYDIVFDGAPVLFDPDVRNDGGRFP